jgi:putative phosphoserine phosphatase/1-acylglycerol-3-phosphate O-acyltransferase
MDALVDLPPAGVYSKRKPSAEELASTYPPGYRGDPANESTRRPGSDL